MKKKLVYLIVAIVLHCSLATRANEVSQPLYIHLPAGASHEQLPTVNISAAKKALPDKDPFPGHSPQDGMFPHSSDLQGPALPDKHPFPGHSPQDAKLSDTSDLQEVAFIVRSSGKPAFCEIIPTTINKPDGDKNNVIARIEFAPADDRTPHIQQKNLHPGESYDLPPVTLSNNVPGTSKRTLSDDWTGYTVFPSQGKWVSIKRKSVDSLLTTSPSDPITGYKLKDGNNPYVWIEQQPTNKRNYYYVEISPDAPNTCFSIVPTSDKYPQGNRESYGALTTVLQICVNR